jgi:hypothetical protein
MEGEYSWEGIRLGDSATHIGEPYGPHRHIYSVRGLGGTSMGGERYGGRNYHVDLDKVECSCNVP